MNNRLLAVLVTVAVVISFPAEAQRRRSSTPPGTPTTVTPPPSNDCASYAPIRAGLRTTYSATGSSGSATYTITYVSDSVAETKTTQKVFTSVGTADAETTLQYEVVNHQGRTVRALKRLLLKATTSGFTIETEGLYAPSFILTPTTDLCVGLKWTSPPVVQTLTTRSLAGVNTQIQNTLGWEGEVLAIENVTVPAGTFRSLKVRGYSMTDTGLTPSISWTSLDHHVLVRQETFDAAGVQTSTHVLTAME